MAGPALASVGPYWK